MSYIKTSFKDTSSLSILLLALVSLLYLLRSSISMLKYPFIVLFLFLFTYLLIKNLNVIPQTIIDFLKHYYLVIILFVILLLGFLLSNKLYLSIFKDVTNAIILILIFFLHYLVINTIKDLGLYYRSFLAFLVLFAVIIAIDGLSKIFNIFTINQIVEHNTTLLTYKNYDYNFAILPVLFGFMICLELSSRATKKSLVLTIYSILLLTSTAILLSGSRRAIFTFCLVVISLLIIYFWSLFSKDEFLKRLGRTGRNFIILGILLSSIFIFIVAKTDYAFKNNILSFIGSRNIHSTKVTIASKLYKFYRMIDNDITLTNFYDLMWTPEFNPYDPESGWGRRQHLTVFPLEGENVEIVPRDAIGYKMDKTCNADTWGGNAYSYTHFISKFSGIDTIYASVFCYVSDDFNGSWARIISGISDKALAYGTDYDFSKKGTWQELTCKICCNHQDVGFFLYFAKEGVTDFETLSGYIIFAYPHIKDINQSENLTHIDLKSKHSGEYKFTPNNSSYSGNHTQAQSASLVPAIIPSDDYEFEDPLRRFISKLISEDTTYSGYSKEFKVDSISNDFANVRLIHYQFAIQLFMREYGLKQKIFGRGFIFLNWYGFYFEKSRQATGYPHNPFLSVLLYSGIIGLVLYMYFIYRVFTIYFRHITIYPFLTIFFLVTFFFSFFSGGSPFDPPVLGFFSILPFFIHSIHKREKSLAENDATQENKH